MSENAELPEDQSRALATRVREELARRRISRQRLADDAKISLSTLEKVLKGSRPFTLATVIRLEEALHLRLRAPDILPASSSESASVALGGYSRAAVTWLEGDYVTLRPSFEVDGAIYSYLTRIGWNTVTERLEFQESERLDMPFSQKGQVSIPNKSGQIYLYTNDDGQMRLAILGRPQIGGEMFGLLATLRAASGGQLQPVSAPLVLIPSANTTAQFGRITQSDPAYRAYHAHLSKAVSGEYVHFYTP